MRTAGTRGPRGAPSADPATRSDPAALLERPRNVAGGDGLRRSSRGDVPRPRGRLRRRAPPARAHLPEEAFLGDPVRTAPAAGSRAGRALRSTSPSRREEAMRTLRAIQELRRAPAPRRGPRDIPQAASGSGPHPARGRRAREHAFAEGNAQRGGRRGDVEILRDAVGKLRRSGTGRDRDGAQSRLYSRVGLDDSRPGRIPRNARDDREDCCGCRYRRTCPATLTTLRAGARPSSRPSPPARRRGSAGSDPNDSAHGVLASRSGVIRSSQRSGQGRRRRARRRARGTVPGRETGGFLAGEERPRTTASRVGVAADEREYEGEQRRRL